MATSTFSSNRSVESLNDTNNNNGTINTNTHTNTNTSTTASNLNSSTPTNKSVKGNNATTKAAALSGEELEEYCKKRGLCPLCAQTRTRKRLFKLFKKNKWEALTITDSQGRYLVYRGYCVKSNCFTLDQAKRLAGERSSNALSKRSAIKRRESDGSILTTASTRNRFRRSSATAPAGTIGDAASVAGSTATGAPQQQQRRRTSQSAFPPLSLKQAGAHATVDYNTPLPVISTTVQALKVDHKIFILDLSSVKLRPIDIEQLSSALADNTRLIGLIMENCKLDDTSIKQLHLNPALPLVKLYLRTNNIGDTGMEHLCNTYLEHSNTLEKLDLSRNKIGSDGGITILNAFARNSKSTRIRCLNISHNELWDLDAPNGAFGAKTCLLQNRTLRVLNLEGNYLHDGVADSLASALIHNDRLERLYLGWNGIGDEGCIAIAKMLEQNETLRVLGVAENDIHNVGARAILSALDLNTSVREISGLWRNKIDRRFIIVAIRRLLLAHGEKSADNSVQNDAVSEQAPSSEFMVPLSGGIKPILSTVGDVDNEDNDGENNDSVPKKIEFDDATNQTMAMTHQEEEATTATLTPMENDMMEERQPPFDRLVVLQASPLVFFNREESMHTSIPLYDVEFEEHAIRDSLGQALGAEIQVQSKIATMDRVNKFFANPNSRIVHLSCHGGPDYISLENGYGALQKLPLNKVSTLFSKQKQISDIQLVFVSSVYAKEIGQAFIDAGVPHVVCCKRDGRFRDPVSIEFAQSFYKALAQNKLLKQAFDIACETVRTSPLVRNMRKLTDRFTLLPENTEKSFFHNLPVFFTHAVPPKEEDDGEDQQQTKNQQSEQSIMSKYPPHYIGREVDMYEIIEALRVDDVVRVGGPAGHGRETVVAAACKYVLSRKSLFTIDNVFWLPATEGVVPYEDSLYGDLCMAIKMMQDARSDIWEDEDYCDCRDRIEIELEDVQSIFVIDDRGFSTRSVQENLEKFISHFMNTTKTKTILITSRSMDEFSTISTISSDSGGGGGGPDDAIEIGPLDFKSTALLFGGISKFIASSGCPVAHSALEFAELLEPPFVSKLQEKAVRPSRRRMDLFERLGGGVPEQIIKSARTMSKEDFIELIGIANRPEVNVDSLAAVERDIELRTAQKEKAIKEKNFFRAMDLEIILEELEAMRTMFPTFEELRQEEDTTKMELAEAVSSRQYELANDLKKELLRLKKQMLKEQRVRASEKGMSAADQVNGIQAQVQSMLDGEECDSSARAATFVVQLDDRDCSIEISCGNLADFEHPAEAIGIVCWTNEGCNLEDNAIGQKLLERGEETLAEDIETLPINCESPWGPVKCGTGNAVIVGPEKYGTLDAPCIILAVGPLSTANWEDIEAHDSDTLHYVKTMLQSGYRSSLVLVKAAQLQAVALSMLTTRPGGSAYHETMKVGLQTILDEVKFSFLRDVHIVASTPSEAAAIVAMLTEMGLNRIND